MCPTSLDEYVGQEHILAPGKVLRKAIEKDLITSLILFGPPGIGKTALARVISNHTNAQYMATAHKSNACYTAIDSAFKDVETERSLEVPEDLKDSHYRGAKTMGYGKGFKYPNDFGGYVEQDYLKVKRKYYCP